MQVSESRSNRKIGSSTNSTISSLTSGSPQPRNSVSAIMTDPLGSALEGTDPLSQFAKEEIDPLFRMAADNVKN
jgi:hypothetical protein